MVAISVPPMDPLNLKDKLFDHYRIEVPITTHKNWLFIRLSIQSYNNASDADAQVQAVQEIYAA
jgi:isopenicillin-N epimerase